MRTVLFATTALIASAGFAAAEVSLSGAAEMGVAGDDSELSSPRFHTDVDVKFTMTGETDTGLTFGADIDLDEEIGQNNGGSDATRNDDDDGGATIFVSGAFGTLTMGDTDGALDWAMQEALIGGSLRDEHEHAGYNGNAGLDSTYDNQVTRYEYAFADFSVAASAEIDDADDGGDPILGLGGRYATEFGGVGVAFGAGVQTIRGLDSVFDEGREVIGIDDDGDNPDNLTIWGLSADATFGATRVILNYSDLDDAGSHHGLAVGYSVDALTVAANYGKYDLDNAGDASGYGLIANYDLGGGAELQAGWGRSEVDGADDADAYALGISMAF